MAFVLVRLAGREAQEDWGRGTPCRSRAGAGNLPGEEGPLRHPDYIPSFNRNLLCLPGCKLTNKYLITLCFKSDKKWGAVRDNNEEEVNIWKPY